MNLTYLKRIMIKLFRKKPIISVAASDASDDDKARADYICDGIDDDVEIQAALDTLPGKGGTILFLGKIFRVRSIDERPKSQHSQ